MLILLDSLVSIPNIADLNLVCSLWIAIYLEIVKFLFLCDACLIISGSAVKWY